MAGPLEKVQKIISKKSHSTENCRTVPKMPYSISLYIEPNTIFTYRTEPYLNTLQSATNQNRVLRRPSRQPIRIEYYVNRVVSQSELSIMSPESSRLRLKTLLGSRLDIAYLNT